MELDTIVCADALAFMATLPDASIDAVITDPPYGNGTQVSKRRETSMRFIEIEGVNNINASWIPEAYRAVRNGGALYCFAKWINFGEWKSCIELAGFTVRNCIVWNKVAHGLADIATCYAPQHEMILFASKGRHILRGSRPKDVISVMRLQANKLTHPYEKPVALLEYLIRASTDPDQIIADPFCGSGSTFSAARNLGRHFVGCDSDAGYVEIARRRLLQPWQPQLMG